jgi:hypothetical protein
MGTRLEPCEANEFLRRFLLHVLPLSFVRIRYFGTAWWVFGLLDVLR